MLNSTLTSLFNEHLWSKISSKVMKYMGQIFSRCWVCTIHALQVLEHKLTGMTIEANTKCYISSDVGCIINHEVDIEKVRPKKKIQIIVTHVPEVLNFKC